MGRDLESGPINLARLSTLNGPFPTYSTLERVSVHGNLRQRRRSMEMAYRERWQAEIAELQRLLSGFDLREECKWGMLAPAYVSIRAQERAIYGPR